MCSPVSVHEFDAVWAHRIMGWEDGSWRSGAGSAQSIQTGQTLQNTHEHNALNKDTMCGRGTVMQCCVLTWHRLLLIIWN